MLSDGGNVVERSGQPKIESKMRKIEKLSSRFFNSYIYIYNFIMLIIYFIVLKVKIKLWGAKT